MMTAPVIRHPPPSLFCHAKYLGYNPTILGNAWQTGYRSFLELATECPSHYTAALHEAWRQGWRTAASETLERVEAANDNRAYGLLARYVTQWYQS